MGRKVARKRQDRDVEIGYSTSEFVEKLRRLADALEQGGPFTITIAGERVRLPAGSAFNIEHEREGGREEIEFQLKWSSADDDDAKKTPARTKRSRAGRRRR